MKFRPLFFAFSGIALLLSIYAILSWGFKLSIDFVGGSIVEYQLQDSVGKEVVENAVLSKEGYGLEEVKFLDGSLLQLRFGPGFSKNDAEELSISLAQSIGEKPTVVKFESIGPSLSQEILKKTYVAVGIASLGILLLIAWQFRSFKFGAFALVALLHDLLILLGVFAVLGHYQGVSLDVLVVTAFLMTLSLSLYDTIIVYDRIRESRRKFPTLPILDRVDGAVTDTIVRSLNTSFTTSFVLVALFLMGGESIKWFVFALLVGVITGTYSSPFVAAPLLVTWDSFYKKLCTRR